MPGRERVNPSIPLPSLKLFSAQQCAHACHAVIVFFREVTFHLYLKTPDACQSLSLLLPHTLSCLWARLWNMHLLKHIEARRLVPLTTWSHVGELVNQLLTQLCTSEAFSSLVKWSCTTCGWNKQTGWRSLLLQCYKSKHTVWIEIHQHVWCFSSLFLHWHLRSGEQCVTTSRIVWITCVYVSNWIIALQSATRGKTKGGHCWDLIYTPNWSGSLSIYTY